MNKFPTFFYSILIVLLSSCLSPIEGEQTLANEGIVIEGLVADQTGRSYVQLSRLEFLNNTLEQFPIENATVRVIENGTNALSFFEESLGVYIPDPSFSGSVESNYSLEIILESGVVITSSVETLPPAIEIDTIEVEFVERKGENGSNESFHNFFVTIPKPSNQTFARFASSGIAETQIEIDPPVSPCRVGGFGGSGEPCFRPCWSFRSRLNEDDIVLINSSTLPDKEFTFFSATEAYDYHQRYYYEVGAFSLSSAGFQYWNSLDQQLNANGSLLDPRLPDLPTNLSISGENTQVFGYFGASALTTKGIVFRRSDTGRVPLPTPIDNEYNCSENWVGGLNGADFTPEPFDR